MFMWYESVHIETTSYSFSYQDQYITLFLALHESFKAKPALQSKEQFLHKVTSLMKRGNMISTSLKEEHEVVTYISIVNLNY